MMARSTWILDERECRMVPALEYYAEREAERHASGGQDGAPMLIPDIAPDQAFISPVDKSYITSRRELREHNAVHGVEQVGNDPAYKNPKPPAPKMPKAGPEIARLMNGYQPVHTAPLDKID